MTRRMGLTFGLALLLAGAMWLQAALVILPAGWPALPLRPDAMTLDQILLGFGLMPRGVVALLAGELAATR